MRTFRNHFLSFHPIDLTAASISSADVSQKAEVFNYASDLIENVISAKDQREYKFNRTTTEVHQAVSQLVGQKSCAVHTQTIANRLLQTEQAAQKRVAAMGISIQKGTLFQIVFERDGVEMILIAKVDLNSFLDETDFKKHIGLPFDKRILKTCLIEFAKGQVERIAVADTNNAEYWWKEFLELEAITNDEDNTKRAFVAIDQYFANRLKRTYPSDYTYLRNNLVGYFRTQNRFSYQDFERTVFGSYRPDNPNLKMDELKAGVHKLQQKQKFDSSFNIIGSAIKARFRRVIALTDSIKLELTEDVSNLSGTIEATRVDGKKGIFIKSDDGYDAFHRK